MKMIDVAIIDFGMGNLFSVKNACEYVGLDAHITQDPKVVQSATGVLLPGVGAFGDAIRVLEKCGMIEAILKSIDQGKPFMGICLGLQLLFEESEEFGHHQGLGILKGTVCKFDKPREGSRQLKIPQVQWNKIEPVSSNNWESTPLSGVPFNSYMYFIHSYRVIPSQPDSVLSETEYGNIRFCSSVQKGSLFACQFHPERSGTLGLQIYKSFAQQIFAKNGKV